MIYVTWLPLEQERTLFLFDVKQLFLLWIWERFNRLGETLYPACILINEIKNIAKAFFIALSYLDPGKVFFQVAAHPFIPPVDRRHNHHRLDCGLWLWQ